MNEDTYVLLDELYFMTSYGQLAEALPRMPKAVLDHTLMQAIGEGWVHYYEHPDGEQSPKSIDFKSHLESLYYLASKQGLLKHNSL